MGTEVVKPELPAQKTSNPGSWETGAGPLQTGGVSVDGPALIDQRTPLSASTSRRTLSAGTKTPASLSGAGAVRPSRKWSGRQDLNLRPPGPQPESWSVAGCSDPVITGFGCV